MAAKKRVAKKNSAKKKVAKKKRVRSADVETKVLLKSKRRCCLCFGLNNDDAEKQGQIAHIDGNRSNSKEDNLAFLCMRHHALKGTKTRQHKGLSTCWKVWALSKPEAKGWARESP